MCVIIPAKYYSCNKTLKDLFKGPKKIKKSKTSDDDDDRNCLRQGLAKIFTLSHPDGEFFLDCARFCRVIFKNGCMNFFRALENVNVCVSRTGHHTDLIVYVPSLSTLEMV